MKIRKTTSCTERILYLAFYLGTGFLMWTFLGIIADVQSIKKQKSQYIDCMKGTS